jgi:hypothetical protein
LCLFSTTIITIITLPHSFLILQVHWEGGHGCRDKKRMSSKDNKKFAGLSKTVSRKAMSKKMSKK